MNQPQLTVIDSPAEITKLIDYLAPFEYIAFDTETTGLHKGSEIIGFSVAAEEDKAFYVILSRWNSTTNTLESMNTYEPSVSLINSLKGKALIMHNGVFDCAMVEGFFKISLIGSLHTDNMILAHLLDENRRVGLKELAREYFGEASTEEQRLMKESVIKNGGVLTKDCYEMYKADPYLMGKYGAKDALLTLKLFYALVPELFEQGLNDFFYKDESMPLLRGPTYQMNTVGVRIDMQALASLKKQLEAECLEAKAFILQEIAVHIKEKYPSTKKKNQFNIGSAPQLSWLLFGKLGLEYGTLTKGGKAVCKALGLKLPYTMGARKEFIQTCLDSVGQIYQPEVKTLYKTIKAKKVKEPWGYIACDKKTLTKLAPKLEWVKRLLEYQRKTKLLNTYVKGLEERVRYGIVQPSFLQHGTSSGRYASRNPNWQNLPKKDKRIKACVVSRPGKVFVGSDFSQLEVRVFASVSGDPALLKSFADGYDFYSVIGMEVYNKTDCKPYKDGSPDAFGIKYEKLRDQAKVIALASTYGASAWQLMPQTGKSEQDTQEDMDRYFEAFPGVAQMMLDSHTLVKTSGEVSTIFGRKRRIPDAKKINKLYGAKTKHADLPYEARSMLNLGVNHRIQGTAAHVCNRAMIKFTEDVITLNIAECYIVSQIHDEIIVECLEKDAELVSTVLQLAMEEAVVLPGVKLEAIPKIANNFADLK